jgi:hypothetical protein
MAKSIGIQRKDSHLLAIIPKNQPVNFEFDFCEEFGNKLREHLRFQFAHRNSQAIHRQITLKPYTPIPNEISSYSQIKRSKRGNH